MVWNHLKPYQQARLTTFLDRAAIRPARDTKYTVENRHRQRRDLG
jgi:hypothetical protein